MSAVDVLAEFMYARFITEMDRGSLPEKIHPLVQLLERGAARSQFTKEI